MTRRKARVASASPPMAIGSPAVGRPPIDPPHPRRWLLALTATGVLAWIAFLAYLAWREA